MPNVKDDLRNIREGLAGIGFSDENEDPQMNDYIVTLENPNFEELNKVLTDVKNRVDGNWKKRENTLVYYYVTGNGVHEGDTSLVCPRYTKGKNSQWKFKIESKLRLLATRTGIYVLALIDVPRMAPKTKGGAEVAADADDIEGDDKNLILTFSCEAGKSNK